MAVENMWHAVESISFERGFSQFSNDLLAKFNQYNSIAATANSEQVAYSTTPRNLDIENGQTLSY